jgi:hypothetical protein
MADLDLSTGTSVLSFNTCRPSVSAHNCPLIRAPNKEKK